MSNSAAAINQQSQSKRRYDLQDRMLQGIADHPNHTAKEICRLIGLQYESYCDGPKRVHDLKKLGKVVVAGQRECSITKRQAETYRLADGARFVGQGRRLVTARPQPAAPTPAPRHSTELDDIEPDLPQPGDFEALQGLLD